jgi:tRNA (mo5U34)-methyltransferase
MDLKQELLCILEQIGPEKIRRPVYDNEGNLLAKGIAYDQDGHPDDLSYIDFSGKEVVDLGCNLGFYSFLARQSGAKHVLGIDMDTLVIKGAEMLRDIYGLKGVDFLCSDFTAPSFTQSFDITLLIDFFGKELIKQGIKKFLDTTDRITRDEMVISARSYYRIEKHFKGHLETLKNRYSMDYIRDGRFYLIEYIRDYFKENWEMTILSSGDHDFASKKTLSFKRK